jgi:hypothetical protein
MESLRRIFDNSWFSFRGDMPKYNRIVPGNRFLPRPAEAYEFWNFHASPDFADSYMEHDADEVTKETLRAAVAELTRRQGRLRFAAKLTGPPRIRFLASVFPDAVFVHVIRDGRAVVQSLLDVDFWRAKGGLHRPFWSGSSRQEILDEWTNRSSEPGMLAALQWRAVVRSVRLESRLLANSRFHEMKYEDYVTTPESSMRQLQESCSLDVAEQVTRHVMAHRPRKDLNRKYLARFDKDYIEAISDAMQPELSLYGYSRDHSR